MEGVIEHVVTQAGCFQPEKGSKKSLVWRLVLWGCHCAAFSVSPRDSLRVNFSVLSFQP